MTKMSCLELMFRNKYIL